MTKQLTPSGDSQMMLAVRRSSLESKEFINARVYPRFPFLHLPLKRLLSKEITLAQHAYEFLLLCIRLLDRHTHLALGDDEEGITACPLAHNVITSLIVRLLKHIGDFDQGILWQILENGHAANIGQIKYRGEMWHCIGVKVVLNSLVEGITILSWNL